MIQFNHVHIGFKVIFNVHANRDLTNKPNRNRNRIDSESGNESKKDINISVRVLNKIRPSLLSACVGLSSTRILFNDSQKY